MSVDKEMLNSLEAEEIFKSYECSEVSFSEAKEWIVGEEASSNTSSDE